jgi:energy-coupling factor transporter ATP-binding protein EcfA2
MNTTANSTLQQVLGELDDVQQTGADEWKARCPAHDDNNPSLSVTVGEDYPVLLHCHAGCEFEEVAEELDSLSTHWKPWEGTEVERYTYRGAGGELLFDVVRYEMRDSEHPACGEKQFMQQAYLPDHEDAGGIDNGCPGGYVWGRKKHGVETVLYRLPKVLKAAEDGRIVFVVEGEKDVHTLEDWGFTATTNPQGAGKWMQRHTEALSGARVVILPDNDSEGREHGRMVAQEVLPVAESVRVVSLPDLPKKGDVTDWANATGTDEKLKEVVEEAPPFEVSPNGHEEPETSEGEVWSDEIQSQSLIRLAEPATLWQTPRGDFFATFPVEEQRRTAPIRQKTFRQWLRRRFYNEQGKPPGSQALQDAVDTLAAMAEFDGEVREVDLRVAGNAEDDGRVYLDLGDSSWEAIEITAGGWTTTADPRARFRRVQSMKPLPTPAAKGRDDPASALNLLREHVRVKDDGHFALLLGWLIQALRPSGPYPVLVITGEQGSGKTTIAKMIRALIDPNHVPTRTAPRSEEDLLVAAENSWVLNFDNLSGVPAWLSDALCRLATGGGFGTRKLYTNREEEVFYHQRPIILNGIEDLTSRPDLADRAVMIQLDQIPEDERATDQDVWKAFEADRPTILSGLLSAVSVGIETVEHVDLPKLPRMADFAKWVQAAEPAFPVESGTFRDAYESNREAANQTALESDEVARAIRALVEDQGRWHGKMSELVEELERYIFNPDDPPVELSNYNSLSSHFKRIRPVLREAGIRREDDEAKRSRAFTLYREEESEGELEQDEEPPF